jgi:hypothetical protein
MKRWPLWFVVPLVDLLLLLAISCLAQAGEPERGWPRVCRNVELLKAIRIIDSACGAMTCDATTLRKLDSEVDRSSLLAAIRDPNLTPVHLFFPIGITEVRHTFDWNSRKRDELATLKYMTDPGNAIVFVLAETSVVGSSEVNQRLSRERMASTIKYLQDVLKVRCHLFRGGWLGESTLQLSEHDASILGIDPADYRHDSFVLNQSVHVFVYPCANLIE